MTPRAVLSPTLRRLADLAEIRGLAAEAADLRNAASAIDALDRAGAAALEQRARRDGLDGEPGISPKVYRRLREVVVVGGEEAVNTASAGIPWLLRRLIELPAIASDEAVSLVRQFGIVTLQDLHAALDHGRITQIAGSVLDNRLRAAADRLEAEARSLPLGRARDAVDALLATLSKCCPALNLLTPAGDVRRFEPLVSALVIVGRAHDPPAAIDVVCASAGVDHVLHRSGRRAILQSQHLEIDVRVPAPDEYGTVLFNVTGSRAHLHAMQQRRGRPGLVAWEEDVYSRAGVSFIPAELRQGAGEVDAAAKGALPNLVTREHIRGDLHMHTTYSDGADTLDAMVAECCALGYEYIAITDHSERAGAARTLTRSDIARQGAAIAAARDRYPQITILHGIEVDIMPDGRLDFPDEVLEPLDIVLASLHDAAHHDARALTRRCIRAIRHPLVTVITHPANQIVGRRPGYALDFDAVFAAAAETGTALEVDGAPAHLDLDGEHARRAIAAGVTLTIDSDCHRARTLDRQMQMGIGTARRGWVEPRHVLNARPLAEVRAFIAAKRARR